MTTFNDFSLSKTLTISLEKMGYDTPTPIQEKAIPMAMSGHDVLGSAQTGTGKTAAFSIPMVQAILETDDRCALVLTPTRELAKQVLDVVHQLLGPKSKINTAFIIGGDSMDKQMSQLRRNPRIVVGTPGRVNDHLKRRTLKLSRTDFLVLDETDRMLDMGFGVQLDAIAEFLPEQRQTLMFSATMPKGIIKVADKYLTDPQRIEMSGLNTVAKKIKQEEIRIEQGAKYGELKNQLEDRMGSVIVFVKTKHGADKMATNLKRDGHTADALHGDLRQRQRDKVMRNFRDMKFRVLIATDIAARGLDVPHIEHVINYDLPQVAEDYIHRMGRTARAGAEGAAISFIASHDHRQWRAIQDLINPEAAHRDGAQLSDRGGRNGGKNGRGKPFKGRGDKHRRGKSSYSTQPKWSDGRSAQSSNDGEQRQRPMRDGGFKKNRNDKAPRAKAGKWMSESDRSSAPAHKKKTNSGQSNGKNSKWGGDKPARSDKAKRFDKPMRSSDKPARSGKSFGEGKGAYAGKPRSDKPRSDKPRSDKPRSDKPRSDKPKSFAKNKKPMNTTMKNSGDRPMKKRRSA